MKDKFFTKLDWAAFWMATIVTLAVYFFTLGPSVGLEDSGELATAAANLGVPHPPGYPFWTFCSWLFCKAFGWVTYMGHPTPAWCVSLCSAVFGAFAAGCTAMLICRSSRDFVSDGKAVDLLCFGGGVGGALTFAFSPVEWSQSTIVEIYSLNALFLMWVFLLSYRWMRKPSDKILWFTAFVFGLGLTNYQVLLFAIVPLALIIFMKSGALLLDAVLMVVDIIMCLMLFGGSSKLLLIGIAPVSLYLLWVVARRGGLFRDVFIYLIPVGLTWQLLQIGQLMRADRYMQSDVINKHEAIVGKAVSSPSTTVLVLALVILVASIVASIFLKKRGEKEKAGNVILYGGGTGAVLMLLTAFVFVSKTTWGGITAPVAPLIEPTRYALIAAFVAGSVVAAVAAALRDDEKLTDSGSIKLVGASAVCAAIAIVAAVCVPAAGDGGYTGQVFPWGKSTAMFWGLIVLLFVLCLFTKKGLCFAIPAAGLHIAAFILLTHGAMNGLTHPMSWWFGWPIAWNFVLLTMAWATLPNGRSVAGAAFFAQLGVSFYAYMPIVSDLRNPPMNWGYPRTWEGFKHALTRGQYEAISFQLPTWGGITSYFKDVMVQFTDVLALLALVPFAVGHWIVKKENRKAFWSWMVPAFACFLMMSVLLIGLANVKGDVQDGFIQKVKFISSHAMIALWIGYGLVFVAVWVLGLLGRRGLLGQARTKLVIAFSAAMILVAGVTPIVQNYTDDQLVFELGGSEQNGHTFGWQFGAYQLEGAKAINDQLTADEEPLPDPSWPPPMDPYSIFFGGTDPGRFVPTYMIYSALYRPDVYLITQNALADDTYMSVERDLYGDEIWIPAKEDSAEAFNIYVDEVQRGVRQANGDLRIENGRVQVTGALGVMEINGILTKMMHDHDRLRHSFYVEESYVIPWMYPYLSPHGLIMRLNADRRPPDSAVTAKDMDFWDWYVRRLLDDPMYRRDFAGQKSFSKLRAAIAGLYQRQGRYREAAQAFREAVALYPASPEATFRYAQEILLPFRKWDVVGELLDYTDRIDPNNRRTGGLREYVERVRRLSEDVRRLESKQQQDGGLDDAEKLVLAGAYYNLGRVHEAARLAHDCRAKASDPSALRMIAQILLDAHHDAEAEEALNAYLKLRPDADSTAWVDLAKLQFRANRKQASVASFNQALRLDAQALQARLGRDEELQRVYAEWAKYRLRQQRQQQSFLPQHGGAR